MPALLRRDFLRATVLVAAVAAVAAADGLARGLTMPPDKVSTALPTLPVRPAAAPADAVQASSPVPAPTPAPTPATTDGQSSAMTAQQLHDAIQTGALVVFDARSREEYVAGHLPMAFSLPMDSFAAGTPPVLAMFPVEQPIVVYCGGGDCHASHNVSSMLQSLGYTNVAVFEGGFGEWSQAGLPTEAGEPPL